MHLAGSFPLGCGAAAEHAESQADADPGVCFLGLDPACQECRVSEEMALQAECRLGCRRQGSASVLAKAARF